MFAYAFLLLTTGIVATVTAKGVQFTDCPCKASQWMTMCTSEQLPHGCECYDISDKSDYKNSRGYKPKCPAELQVIFYLYTHSSPDKGDIIKVPIAMDSVVNRHYGRSHKTIIVAHSLEEHGKSWCPTFKSALIGKKENEVNVICVDWQQGAKGHDYKGYLQAVANTRTVGSLVARLIQELIKTFSTSFENFHLIGNGLGAHIMGYAGKEIFRLTKHKVGRISGLDPAGPQFEGYSIFVRIDSTDAQYVDIIYTNMGHWWNCEWGMRRSVGHVNFFVNGGASQPQCACNDYKNKAINYQGFKNIQDFEGTLWRMDTGCSHNRAKEYFINSVEKCHYYPILVKCHMGYNVSRMCRGNFVVITKNNTPYC